ncbi:alkylated DNA repair protein alkB like 6 [Fusarium austroafricanum]|uniref:Alkylated DNA repair protein alkB like 6 n=1 Tax=Fusarium austroafricanum TaxID=2364996 RepID=A0A8H4PEG0_9HYPO|nr:alkylated DNA repair protein alkB like 6 [Fusarium austroafricanum]
MDPSNSASPSTDKAGILLPPSLEHARITTLPQTAYYIPDFITEEEERVILEKISSAPKPRWKQLTKRRLQTWPSDLVNNKLLDAPLPAWLQDPVVSRLLSLPAQDFETGHIFEKSPHKKPNHDGSAYFSVVCTVSLGASLCLNLHRSKDDGALDPVPTWRILQEPRSLLITTDQLYTDYLHGIADIEEDVDLDVGTVANWDLLRSPGAYASGRNVRQTRTSLTYRDVLQVSKVANKLGMFLKR